MQGGGGRGEAPSSKCEVESGGRRGIRVHPCWSAADASLPAAHAVLGDLARHSGVNQREARSARCKVEGGGGEAPSSKCKVQGARWRVESGRRSR